MSNHTLDMQIDSKYKIEHLGKTFLTKHYDCDITDKEIEDIRIDFYKDIQNEKNIPIVHNEIYSLLKGRTLSTTNIDMYFVRKLMYSVKRDMDSWNINEFVQSNDLIRVVVAKIKKFKDFYKGNSYSKNLEQFFRVGSSNTATKIGNYPLKSVKEILLKYNINNKYYDYSCGWGRRLMGAIIQNVEYYGTDPNYLLVDKLNEINRTFNKFTTTKVDIRAQGSEIYIPEWSNTMGIAFSSPPYFNLERYNIGEQSTLDVNYTEWLDVYWRATVQNIEKYLIPEGYLLLNVKSYSKYDLVNDMKQIVTEHGFIYTHNEHLDVITRSATAHLEKTNNEIIMVFRKEGYKTNPHVQDIVDEW